MPAHSVLCLSYPSSSRPSFATLPAERGTWNSVASATIQGHVYVASTCLQGHVPVRKRSCPDACKERDQYHRGRVGGWAGTWKRTVAAWYQFQPLLTNGWPHTVRHCANPVPHTHTHTHTHTLVRTHHVRMRVWPRNVRHCANPAPHTHTCACVAPHRTSLREPCAAERGVGGEKKERGTE